MHKRYRPHLRGFTLVELLVVIVVVSILATMSVMGYNGVTRRAHDSKVAATLAQVAGAIDLYLARESPHRIPPQYHAGSFFDEAGNGRNDHNHPSHRVYDAPGLGRVLIDKGYLPSDIQTVLLDGLGKTLYPTGSARTGNISMTQCGSGKLFIYSQVFYGGITDSERFRRLSRSASQGGEDCVRKQRDQWLAENGLIDTFGGSGGGSNNTRWLMTEITYEDRERAW